VFCTEAEANALTASVLDPHSAALSILGRGFHRVVVADVSRRVAVDLNGSAQARFLVEVCRAVGAAFGLNLDPNRFHAADVYQILKDEPRSLFCFVHFERVPADCFPTARAFTQSQHRALFLNEGPRNLAVEERHSRASRVVPEDSDASDALSNVSCGPPPDWSAFDDDIPPLPQKLTPAQSARLAEIFDYLHRGLTLAVENIDANEDGTEVRIGFAEWQTIQAVQMLLARYGRTIAEPEHNKG
jgi:hypothetical protein